MQTMSLPINLNKASSIILTNAFSVEHTLSKVAKGFPLDPRRGGNKRTMRDQLQRPTIFLKWLFYRSAAQRHPEDEGIRKLGPDADSQNSPYQF